MNELNNLIANEMIELGVQNQHVDWGTRAVILLVIILASFIATRTFRHLVMPVVQRIAEKTKVTWDDYMFSSSMLTAFSRIIPPIIWYMFLPLLLFKQPTLLNISQKACMVYLIVVVLKLINLFMNTLNEISNEHERLRNRPLKGIYQMINLISIGVGMILIISILIDRDATSILAGLGASAAILMLIFKDSILGLVAGVQLSANDMLRPGDWITMPKYGADGTVVEVSLTTVKVQNFDKTITTIPPYVLVSDSFQNWRGMRESDGRRIKRSLNIDMRTVHFCSSEEIKLYTEKGLIPEDMEIGEKTVNLEVFRRHIIYYLQKHKNVNNDMTLMFRQMQPTPEGLPMEIYCFSKKKDWIDFENVQADLFNYIIAIVPEFGLQVFQRPSGNDFYQKEKEEIL